MSFQSLNEVGDVLATHAPSRMTNATYDLSRITVLLEHLGNPQNALKVVHVTGTSGKTSTTYYARAILEAAGQKVGLTVSPHINTICERVQIGGGQISESDFVRYFNDFYTVVADFKPRPTYFELMTAFAYWVFKKEQVDYAVIEVGLGGRYDATNTVMRPDKVCVINSIGYDHTEILGDTLAAIAGEKAGIIQHGNVVFTVEQDDEVAAVIAAEVAKKEAKLTIVRPDIDASKLAPAFQQHNFQLALAAVRYLAERDNLKLPAGVEEIAERVTVPGRFELYKVGDKTVVLDGAHNPQKLEALLGVLREKSLQPAVVVAGISEAPEAKVAECVRLLSEFSEKSIYTTFSVQRDVTRHGTSLEILSKFMRSSDERRAVPEDALKRALESKESYIVVTGSLYLVSILRPIVQRLAELSA